MGAEVVATRVFFVIDRNLAIGVVIAVAAYLIGGIVVTKLPRGTTVHVVAFAAKVAAEDAYVAPTIAKTVPEPQLPVVAEPKAALPTETAPAPALQTTAKPVKRAAGKKLDLPDDSAGKPLPLQQGAPSPNAQTAAASGTGNSASTEANAAKAPSALNGAGEDAATIYDLGNVDVPPRPSVEVEPEYPEIAQRRGITGIIVVAMLVVEANGTVRSVQPHCYGCHAAFLESVRKALIKWKFKPAQLHGRAVAVRFEQEIHFDLMENR